MKKLVSAKILLAFACAFTPFLAYSKDPISEDILMAERIWTTGCNAQKPGSSTYVSDFYSVYEDDGIDPNHVRGQYFFQQRIFFYSKEGCERYQSKVDQTPNTSSHVFLAKPFGLEKLLYAQYGEVASFDVDEVLFEKVDVSLILRKQVEQKVKNLQFETIKVEIVESYITAGRNIAQEFNSTCIFSGEENISWQAGISRSALGKDCEVFNGSIPKEKATATITFAYNLDDDLVCFLSSNNRLTGFSCETGNKVIAGTAIPKK